MTTFNRPQTGENSLLQAVAQGSAYRVSKRQTMADGDEFIIHFEPVSTGGIIHIEPPAIEGPEKAHFGVWENADPGTSTNDDLLVHNKRYDGTETPEATITRVTSGGLDTSSADKTEESLIRAGASFNEPGGGSVRGIWRTIPVGETVSLVITDQSNGSGNEYSFDTVMYESSGIV